MRLTLKALDDRLIQHIVDEAVSTLAEVGIEVRGAKLRNHLLERGLRPDSSRTRLLFPQKIIEDALSAAPDAFVLFNRRGEPFTHIGGDAVHFTPASSALNILDHRSGEKRLANTADFVEYIRLVDGMQHIAYPSTAFSTNNDIDPQVSDAWRLYLCLMHSVKPVVSGAFTEHGVGRMGEMMALFRHDRKDLIERPLAIFTITATGNFRYSEDSCQNLMDCVEWGIPVEIVPVTLMGLIAPVTLVGAAVFHTVDVLAGVVMTQLLRPGAPVLFGGAPASFHMREATSPMLGIEALHLNLLCAAIGKTLKLPTQAYMALSDAKFLDAQAGAETFGSALLAGMAGINSISGPGMLDFVMTFSLPKLVFDNELCGQVHRLLRPVAPVEDLPARNLVKAQLADEHLLTAEHTLAYWPQQLYLPGEVFDRKNDESWIKAGRKDLTQRAAEEVEERLRLYEPVETPEAIDEEMRRIISCGRSDGRPLPEIPPFKRNVIQRPRSERRRRQNRRKRR